MKYEDIKHLITMANFLYIVVFLTAIILVYRFAYGSNNNQLKQTYRNKKSLSEILKGFINLGGRRDSNPRPLVPQTNALTN